MGMSHKDTLKMTGPQFLACIHAYEKFKQEETGSDINCFRIFIADDSKESLEIIFVPDRPNDGMVYKGGSTPYGREVHYIIEKNTYRIIKRHWQK